MNFPKNRAQTAARLTLGLVFTVFGLNGFLHFLPQPPAAPEAAAFGGALAATGYMFPLIKGTELVAGLLLLAGRAVPFALTLLAPIVVNIVAFHLFLDPAGSALGLATLALGLYLAWTERAVFAPLFASRARAARTTRAPAGGHAGATAT
ncbi:MAG TPA: DoxX family protein [Polyangiaceae bacterium]